MSLWVSWNIKSNDKEAVNAALYAIKSLKIPAWSNSNRENSVKVKYWFSVENL